MASTINADNGVVSGSSGVKTTADTSGVLALQTNGTTAVTVDTSQNVGVGTTAPSTTFNVVAANVAGTDNLGNVYIRTTDSYASADVGGKLTLGGFYNGAAHYAFAGVSGRKENATVSNVAGYLQLLTTTSGGALTERARITSTGAWSFGSSGTATGTSGQVLTSGGSSAAPSWSTLTVSGSGGATATGSVTLTSASGGAQSITPSDYGQYVKLPDATTMSKAACVFTVENNGTYPIKILNNSGSVLGFLYPGDTSVIGLADNSTAAGVWSGSNWDILAVTGSQTYTTSSNFVLRDQIELDSSRTLFLINDSVALYGQVFNSSTATWGTLTTIRSGNTSTSARGWLVTTNTVLVNSEISTARSAVVLTFSDTTITVNTAATATISSATTVARFTVGTTFILVQQTWITAFTVSGTTVTVGTQTAIASGTGTYAAGYQVTSSSGLVITGTSANSVRTYAFTLSGTTFTLSAVNTISAPSVSITPDGLQTAVIGSQWIAVYRSNAANSPVGATIYSVSGTTITASSLTNLYSAFSSTSIAAIYVTGNKCAVWGSASNWVGLNIITNTSGTATAGTAWTANIGSVTTGYPAFTSGTTAMFTARVTSNFYVLSADLSGSSPTVTYVGEFYGVGSTSGNPSVSAFNRVFQGSVGVGLGTYTFSGSYTPITVVNATKYYAASSKIYSTFLLTDIGSLTPATPINGNVNFGTALWAINNSNWTNVSQLVKIETIT